MAVDVSVLMPAYNAEAYIAASLSSVLDQTFTNFELMVVNDGSTDGTAEIIADFAARDRRVRLLSKPNSGISETLNLGLAQAQGPLIARLDADDIMLPKRLERQAGLMSQDAELTICGSDFECIDGSGKVRSVVTPPPHTRADYQQMVTHQAALSFTHPTVMYRRDVALAVGGYDRRYEPAEDMRLFNLMLKQGGYALVIPETLNQYRMHGTSISRNNIRKQCVMAEYVRRSHYELLDGGQAETPKAFLAKFEHLSAREPMLQIRLLKRLAFKMLEYRRMGV